MADARKLVLDKAREVWPDDPRSQAYFAALAEQESGFNPSAHNTQGEDSFGLFQFGPALRNHYGIGLDSPPEAQVAAAADYLSGLHRKYGGDWTKVLAEHNLGLPRVDRMSQGKVDTATTNFFNGHLPAVEARLGHFGGDAMPMPPFNVGAPSPVPTVAAASGPGGPQGGIDLQQFLAQLAQLSPEDRAKLSQVLLGGMGNQSGIMDAPQMAAQPTMDPRVLASMASQGHTTGPLMDPTAIRNQLYPQTGMPGGPQNGYLQVLGGSIQNPEPVARQLAIASLLQNALTGWNDARAKRGQQQPPQAPPMSGDY